MPSPIRILVVDDHPSTRRGLATILAEFDDRFAVVAEACSVEEALYLADRAQATLVLTDYDFGPGKPTGVDLIAQLQTRHPSVRSILMTAFTGDSYLLLAHDAGASAFLNKDASISELVRAIESVGAGFTHFPEALRRALAQREQEPQLTARESEILPLIAKGLKAKEIARELSRRGPDPVTDRTVEVHKGNIRRKFGLTSSNALMALAIDFCQKRRIAYR